jgi:hypothetical protein
MFALDVRSNAAEIIKQIGFIRTDQLPFATAKALTDTARDAVAVKRAELPNEFTVRRPWIINGIVSTPATKQSLTAIVRDRDPFMEVQETGGIKSSINRRVFDYGEYLAVPLDARRNKRDVVDRRDWPKNLIDPFVLTARDGRKYLAVHEITVGQRQQSVRTARGKQRRTSGTRLMYVLIRREAIRARLGLRATVTRVARERFPVNFVSALRTALSTAR